MTLQCASRGPFGKNLPWGINGHPVKSGHLDLVAGTGAFKGAPDGPRLSILWIARYGDVDRGDAQFQAVRLNVSSR